MVTVSSSERRSTTTALGRRVRLLREQVGLTGTELAKRSGLSAGHLGDIEHGRVQHPRAHTLTRLADGLGMTVDELLSRGSDRRRTDAERMLLSAYHALNEYAKRELVDILDEAARANYDDEEAAQ